MADYASTKSKSKNITIFGLFLVVESGSAWLAKYFRDSMYNKRKYLDVLLGLGNYNLGSICCLPKSRLLYILPGYHQFGD